MSYAYRCELCDELTNPLWRIERYGDAVVLWACSPHLGRVCELAQREWEPITKLQITDQRKTYEVAE